MKVLIIGNGGREHALAWKTAQSKQVEITYVAPGNAGTALESKIENVDISVEDIEALVSFAKSKQIDLTIIGPEAPLVLGVVDAFNAEGLLCFGPTKAAAQLEGSKAFAKDFLKKHNIPTASYECFTDQQDAIAYIKQQGAPIVVKADGLAAGKGVVVAMKESDAIDAVKDMLSGNCFGEAGHRVVIEEFLQGEEASFICMVNGDVVLPLASSQDHKARDDGDKGPNTGGMGAYSPAPIIDNEMYNKVMQSVITPTVTAMIKEGLPYCGFLYAGLMITQDKDVKVLEYNCRMGDPETQPIMMRLQSDLTECCLAVLNSKLTNFSIKWDQRTALGVVMAAGGYPKNYNTGDKISGIENQQDNALKTFLAGVRVDETGQCFTNGGRVLCVTALGESLLKAKKNAYQAVENIDFDQAFYRRDIGNKALNN